jgi:hypothetical protein
MSAVSQVTPAEMLRLAEAWYERQIAVLAACHGHRWPEVKDWLGAYLREELRQRLIARGWRPKR